ncbi:hypothetical protein DICVIV_04781 [Dictyocaulus viviparus]|uniref:Uncharacterized protein n=1 Tax=Dictyocaulus viviparus TaxID=29172 RepID=A0A0D8XZ82_DICVI|nr:hypothetical protein DICVIV_04781 [Dictyocaulus viviparus]
MNCCADSSVDYKLRASFFLRPGILNFSSNTHVNAWTGPLCNEKARVVKIKKNKKIRRECGPVVLLASKLCRINTARLYYSIGTLNELLILFVIEPHTAQADIRSTPSLI